MPECKAIYDKNDNTIKALGLKIESTGVYLDGDDTVTVTLKDLAGTNLTGQSWPLTLAYVAASNGDFTGVLLAALALTSSQEIVAEISVAELGGLVAFWKLPLIVRERDS